LNTLRFAAAIGLSAAQPLSAQFYFLRPSPVLDPKTVNSTVVLSGVVSVKHTESLDTGSTILRNARLGIVVKALPTVFVKLQADFAGAGRLSSDSTIGGFAITDGFIQLMPVNPVKRIRPALIVGQFKTPFSLEYQTSVTRLLTSNRTLVVDRLAPRRELGALGQLNFLDRVILTTSVVNGAGSNARTNTDTKNLATARLTTSPVPQLALSAKIGNEGSDHLWGYDFRWMPARTILEGEFLRRHRFGSTLADLDGHGGYVMAAYHATAWLQPVVKWERYQQTEPSLSRETWTTFGANVNSAKDNVRALFDAVRKMNDEKGDAHTDFIAQLVVYF
jgi:hypothetical protein